MTNNQPKYQFCGRFLNHFWYQTNEHEDDWEEYWKCLHEHKEIKNEQENI